MNVLVDDVGSFPLPPQVNRKDFDEAYVLARKAIERNKKIENDEFVFKNFYKVTVDSFRRKLKTGLDIVTYPQHYDMHRQLADSLKESMASGTYLIDDDKAFLPEIYVVKKEAKRLYEEWGRKIDLRVCVIGPMESYLREVGTEAYNDVLLLFAENVRRFASNSILNSKYVKTAVVSVDEPSFGFHEIALGRNALLCLLEKTFDFGGTAKQIHLHSTSRFTDILDVSNIDVLSFEFAASPGNIDNVSRSMLDHADKDIRVGVSRTDIDSIMAELHDKGLVAPTNEQIVEGAATIQKRCETAKKKYGDRMTYTGPDCGLGGWPTQEVAQLVLRRTVSAVRRSRSF